MQTKQLLRLNEAQAKPLELLPDVLLKQTNSSLDALRLMVMMSGNTHESLSSEINKPRETLTKFLNGNAGFYMKDLANLINASGNVYLLQYLAHKHGFELKPIDQAARRKAELLEELKQLEAAA